MSDATKKDLAVVDVSHKEMMQASAEEMRAAKKAFAYAIINEGLKPLPDDECEIGRDTAIETVAARLWLEGAQGNIKAIHLLKETIDGKDDNSQAMAIATAAAAGASAAAIITQLSDKLLLLKPQTTIDQAPQIKTDSIG